MNKTILLIYAICCFFAAQIEAQTTFFDKKIKKNGVNIQTRAILPVQEDGCLLLCDVITNNTQSEGLAILLDENGKQVFSKKMPANAGASFNGTVLRNGSFLIGYIDLQLGSVITLFNSAFQPIWTIKGASSEYAQFKELKDGKIAIWSNIVNFNQVLKLAIVDPANGQTLFSKIYELVGGGTSRFLAIRSIIESKDMEILSFLVWLEVLMYLIKLNF
jgi:hypothetical protein